MKNTLVVLAMLLTISNLLYSQQKNIRFADVSLSAGNGFSPAFSINKLWGVGKNGKFKIGTGLRLTSFFTGELDYITAPAKLTSGQKGPQVLFSENILSNLDTLKLSSTALSYINIPIHLHYDFNKKFGIGFNIDAIGVSFGGKQSGKFFAKESKSLNNTTQTAKPTFLNLLLVSDNDLGSLNSELYVRYWVNEKIGLRAGVSFQFSEYKTGKKLTFENDRFRSKNLLPMIAFSYKL